MGANTGRSVAAAKPKVGGGLYWAPPGTALPTDESTALPAAFKALGPISEEGVTPSTETSVEKIKEWDGSTLAALLTDESRSFETVLYGVQDEDLLTYLYGEENVTVTDGKLAVLDKGGKPEDGVLVFEMQYKGRPMRKIVPVADAVVSGEEPWQGSALMGYTLTIEAIKDDAGVRVYEYSEIAPA